MGDLLGAGVPWRIRRSTLVPVVPHMVVIRLGLLGCFALSM